MLTPLKALVRLKVSSIKFKLILVAPLSPNLHMSFLLPFVTCLKRNFREWKSWERNQQPGYTVLWLQRWRIMRSEYAWTLTSDINHTVMHEHFPIQTLEDSISRMPSAKVFSDPDANDDFWQVKLAKARYSFTCLPFGIASAPKVFQNMLCPICYTVRLKAFQSCSRRMLNGPGSRWQCISNPKDSNLICPNPEVLWPKRTSNFVCWCRFQRCWCCHCTDRLPSDLCLKSLKALRQQIYVQIKQETPAIVWLCQQHQWSNQRVFESVRSLWETLDYSCSEHFPLYW